MNKNVITRVTLLAALMAILTLATACRNTAHGVGEDMERAGEKIQDTTK